jgi:hypothetical protein
MVSFASLYLSYGSKLPDGQITSKILSSPIRKNFPLNPSGKSALKLAPTCSGKRGVGHRHERWDRLRWTRQRRARDVFAGRFSVSECGAQDERR